MATNRKPAVRKKSRFQSILDAIQVILPVVLAVADRESSDEEPHTIHVQSVEGVGNVKVTAFNPEGNRLV